MSDKNYASSCVCGYNVGYKKWLICDQSLSASLREFALPQRAKRGHNSSAVQVDFIK